jgi:hypothetical protein
MRALFNVEIGFGLLTIKPNWNEPLEQRAIPVTNVEMKNNTAKIILPRMISIRVIYSSEDSN